MATTKPISLLTQKIRDSTEESIPTKKSVPSAYYPKNLLNLVLLLRSLMRLNLIN